jgi:hypothetical protein
VQVGGSSILQAVPAFQLRSLGESGAENLLSLDGAIHKTVIIESSDNFADWNFLMTFTASNHTVSFRDSTGARPSKRYYRAVIP